MALREDPRVAAAEAVATLVASGHPELEAEVDALRVARRRPLQEPLDFSRHG